MGEATIEGYEHRAIGAVYDLLNRALWLPYGSDRLRRDVVAALALRPSERVLELGCGTGLVTRHLVATGADVLAVDGAPTMQHRARRRAPGATFEHRDVRDGLPDGPFDAVVLGFVLHELDPATRAELLRGCTARLSPSGRVGVLEWATPPARVRGAIWRRAVRAIEPAVAHDVLDGALAAPIAAAGLSTASRTAPAGGRAEVLVLVPEHPRER